MSVPGSGAYTVCVVGNGPSAKGKADYIDGHNFVVRINGWWLTNPPPAAGRRIDAWAWNSALYFVGLREKSEKNRLVRPPPAGRYELWVEAHRGGNRHVRNAQMAQGIIGRRTVRWLDRKADALLTNRLSALAGRRVTPSTGIRALARAAERWRDVPAILTVMGFDATTPDRPGWNDAGNPWRKTWNLHDFAAEKKLLAGLADTGTWLGRPVKFRLDWVGRPDEVHA